MASGLPYDSDEGRALAGAITAIMHGQAYLTSAEHAGHLGPFDGFALNREPMLRVMEMHRDAVEAIDPSVPGRPAGRGPRRSGTSASTSAASNGYRNSQVTVLAPTGTIAFMMDCDTTGIEPDIALVKYKQLAGGGMLKIVNRTVPMALRKLGYDEPDDPRRPRLHRRARHDRRGARACRTSTCRSSTAPSPRRRGAGASTAGATCG